MTKRRRTIKAAATESPRFLIVSHAGYPFDVLVTIGATGEQILERLERYEVELSKKRRRLILKPCRVGRTIMLGSNQTLIMLAQWLDTPRDHAILAHEIFHAVTLLFGRIGIQHSDSSDEAYAYAVEALTERILTRLAKPKRP